MGDVAVAVGKDKGLPVINTGSNKYLKPAEHVEPEEYAEHVKKSEVREYIAEADSDSPPDENAIDVYTRGVENVIDKDAFTFEYVLELKEYSDYIENLIENSPPSDEPKTIPSGELDLRHFYSDDFSNLLVNVGVVLETYTYELADSDLDSNTDEFTKQFQKLLDTLVKKRNNLNAKQQEQVDVFYYRLRDFITSFPENAINNSDNRVDPDFNIISVVQAHSKIIAELIPDNFTIKVIVGEKYTEDMSESIGRALLSVDSIDELKKVKEFLAQEKHYIKDPKGSGGSLVKLFKTIDSSQYTDEIIVKYLTAIETAVDKKLEGLKQEQKNINNIAEGINRTCQQIYNENQNLAELVSKRKKLQKLATHVILDIDSEIKKSSSESKVSLLQKFKDFIGIILNKIKIPINNNQINKVKNKISLLAYTLNKQNELYCTTVDSPSDSSFHLSSFLLDNTDHNLNNGQITDSRLLFTESVSSYYNILYDRIYQNRSSIENYEDAQQIKKVLTNYMQVILTSDIKPESILLLYSTQQALEEIIQNVNNKKYNNINYIASDLEAVLHNKLQENSNVIDVSIDSSFILESRAIVSNYKLESYKLENYKNKAKDLIKQLEEVGTIEGHDSQHLINKVHEIIEL